jgi:oligoendopeptidase F
VAPTPSQDKPVTAPAPRIAAPEAPVPGGETASDLPAWDLTDLYPGRDSPEIKADLDRAEAEAKAFAARYQGRLASLSGSELAAAIASFERIEETLGRVMSYAQLHFAEDATDPAIGKFYQGCNERVTAISSHLIFFTLELNRIEDAALEAKIAGTALEEWRPWLRDLRVFRPHQLSDELEKLLHEKEVTGRAAWNRLFDETLADLRIPVDGEALTLSAETCGCSHWSPTRSPRTRRSSTRGGGIRSRRATGTARTWSRTRWSRRWSPRSRRPSRDSRTATTR